MEDLPRLVIDSKHDTPEWAVLERLLIDVMNEAAKEVVETYTRSDGTLIWREDWPGMDGSDDAYELFSNFPLFYALGGSEAVHQLARKQWEAVTWQWTQYGTVEREFDAYYDWMHHGESYIYFYYFGLADPSVFKDRQRALNFADMYTGDDPGADNYDPEHRLIRSPLNGSRGPRLETTPEDWSTHRWVYTRLDLPPIFEDIPGVTEKADWEDDQIFLEILERINERMVRGDVPLNLAATSLVMNAFMYSGKTGYRDWILEYLEAWRERTERNKGITPDNVGLSDEIGEYMDGNWWGGYYGWRWPHGAPTVIEPLIIAGANAATAAGRLQHLDLARSQLDRLWSLGRKIDGEWKLPHRHNTAEGWTDFRVMDPMFAIHLWTLSRSEEDRKRVRRFIEADEKHQHDRYRLAPWFRFVQGENPGYPVRVLKQQYRQVTQRLERIRSDGTDPRDWYIQAWARRNPVMTQGLCQLTLGAPENIFHGGLMHCPLRYFDGDLKRAGLPQDVAALVEERRPDGVTVKLVNLSNRVSRKVIIQAGGFGEHRFKRAETAAGEDGSEVQFNGSRRWLEVRLNPGCGTRLKLTMEHYVNQPTYRTPWFDPTTMQRLRGRTRSKDDLFQLRPEDYSDLQKYKEQREQA